MFVFKKYWEIPNDSYNLTETLWKIQKRQKRTCQCYSTQERVGSRYWKHGKAHTKAGKSLSLRWPRPSIVDPQVAALGPGRLSVPVRTVTPLTTVMSPPWLWLLNSGSLCCVLRQKLYTWRHQSFTILLLCLSFWKVVRSVSSADWPATWCPIISFSFLLSPSRLRGFVAVWLCLVCVMREWTWKYYDKYIIQ